MSKLDWSVNDVANTETHCYRVEEIGSTIQVVYSKKPDGVAMKSCYLESVEAAKQWSQNYHNKYGVAE